MNYVGHKTIHIILLFTRSRESKDMEILGTEFQLTRNDSVVIRIKGAVTRLYACAAS